MKRKNASCIAEGICEIVALETPFESVPLRVSFFLHLRDYTDCPKKMPELADALMMSNLQSSSEEDDRYI